MPTCCLPLAKEAEGKPVTSPLVSHQDPRDKGAHDRHHARTRQRRPHQVA